MPMRYERLIYMEEMMDLIKFVEESQMRKDLPELEIGDLLRIHLKVVERNEKNTRERIQIFEGYLIARDGGGLTETITVRKTSYGIGVEKILPLHSPTIDKIEKVRSGKVRRAKLYYLRDRSGKSARIKGRK